MIVSGEMTVASPREELWAVLSDPARLAQALPGVGEVSIEDERRFSAVAHPFTALGETRVAMDFEIVEQRPGEFVRIDGSGHAGENLIAVSVALELKAAGRRRRRAGERRSCCVACWPRYSSAGPASCCANRSSRCSRPAGDQRVRQRELRCPAD